MGLQLDEGKALDGVSCNVGRGEWVVLLGANGSGKSTLARLANGLLLPTEGDVLVDGISSWQHEDLWELRHLVGLVTQDPDNQIVSTTVFDEIAFGPQNLGWEPERIYAAVSAALQQAGLPEEEFAKRDPNSLSGGEKQRAVIASVLAMQPHYLVLDEPTALLDPCARAHVLESIVQAAKEGHGILHITHLLDEAARADRVLVLDRGRLVYDGAPAGILDDTEALTRYGLLAKPRLLKTAPQASDAGMGTQASDAGTGTQAAEITPRENTDGSLQLKEVSFSYSDNQNDAPALQDVSLSLQAGECLLLVGASGSGKSTLLALAAGLLQPEKGSVHLIRGEEQPSQTQPEGSGAPSAEHRSGKQAAQMYPESSCLAEEEAPRPQGARASNGKHSRKTTLFSGKSSSNKKEKGAKKGSGPVPGEVGLVFQQPETQLFAQTVFDDILFGPRNLGLLTSQNGTALVEEVLLAVGLEPARFMDRSPFSLSGGEARRVAIATILALGTDFLLLDEPTAGLDARGKAFIHELIQKLTAEGRGVIIATHDPRYFEDIATGKKEL